MLRWLQLSLLIFIIGSAKAHMIRWLILAAMGLAGLWMLHTLAQDFNKIYTSWQGSSPPKFLSKRSISNSSYNSTETVLPEEPEIDWERVLSRDPVGCARSFVCQLAATNPKNLVDDENIMLHLIELTTTKTNWANKQLQKALQFGKKASAPSQCRKEYKLCPYSSNMMMSLLKIFGET